jgi:hypothetical protein
MYKLISIIAGLLTLMSGFHFYINISSNEEISFEKAIKILMANLIKYPIKTVATILLIILSSLLVSYFLNKLINYINYKEKRREQKIKNSIQNYSKRQEIKDLIFDKIVNKKIPSLETREKPWTRIKPNFHKIIVRDIQDKSFPELGNWFKLETFDLTKDGIEFFDRTNTIGFDLYFDQNYHWDVFHNAEKLKPEEFNKAERAYCIDFIPYEEILHVDWEYDNYNSCITMFCQFKLKHNGVRHPFKEYRYYVLGHGFLSLLENIERRNFKPILWRFGNKISKPIRLMKIYFRNREYYRQ